MKREQTFHWRRVSLYQPRVCNFFFSFGAWNRRDVFKAIISLLVSKIFGHYHSQTIKEQLGTWTCVKGCQWHPSRVSTEGHLSCTKGQQRGIKKGTAEEIVSEMNICQYCIHLAFKLLESIPRWFPKKDFAVKFPAEAVTVIKKGVGLELIVKMVLTSKYLPSPWLQPVPFSFTYKTYYII